METPAEPRRVPRAEMAPAVEAAKTGRHADAVHSLTALRDRWPDDTRVGAWLGFCLEQLGETERSLPLLERAARERPDFARGHRALLRALVAAGRPADALAHLDRLGASHPVAEAFRTVRDTDSMGARFAAAHASSRPLDDELFVFYHVPFTGGTSLQVAFHSLFSPGHSFNVTRRGGPGALDDWNALDPATRRTVRYVHLHHPLPIDIDGRRWRGFCVLRDPVAQFVSGWSKRLERAKILPTVATASRADLGETLALARERGITDGQTKQVVALHPDLRRQLLRRPRAPRVALEEEIDVYRLTRGMPTDELVDMAVAVLEPDFVVGTLEHLESSFLRCVGDLGIPFAPRLGHRGASGDRDRRTHPAAVLEAIAEAHPADRALHEWACARAEAATTASGSAQPTDPVEPQPTRRQ